MTVRQPPDATLGSTKVLIKLQEEFRSLGHTCDVLLADRLHAPDNPYLRQGLAPIAALLAVRRLGGERGAYDVIDVAGAEGLWIAQCRTGVRSCAAVVARSNGLEHLNTIDACLTTTPPVCSTNPGRDASSIRCCD
jgi:hypothetical protein